MDGSFLIGHRQGIERIYVDQAVYSSFVKFVETTEISPVNPLHPETNLPAHAQPRKSRKPSNSQATHQYWWISDGDGSSPYLARPCHRCEPQNGIHERRNLRAHRWDHAGPAMKKQSITERHLRFNRIHLDARCQQGRSIGQLIRVPYL